MKEKNSEEDDENLLSPILSTNSNLVPSKGFILPCKAVSEKRSGCNKGPSTFRKKSKKLKCKRLINPLSCTFFTDAKSWVTDEPTVESNGKLDTVCGNTVDGSIQNLSKEDEENVLSPILSINHNFIPSAVSFPPCKTNLEEMNCPSISPTFEKKFKKSNRQKLIDPLNYTFFLDAEVSETSGLIVKSNEKFSALSDNGSDCSIRKQNEEDEGNCLSPTLLTYQDLVSNAVSSLPNEAESGERSCSVKNFPTFVKKLTKSNCKKLINPSNCTFFLNPKSSVTVDEVMIKLNEKYCASNNNDSESPVRKQRESQTGNRSAKPGNEVLLTSQMKYSDSILLITDLNEANKNLSPELISAERASPVDPVSPIIQVKRTHFDSTFNRKKNTVDSIHSSTSVESKGENSLEDYLKISTKSSSSSTDIIEASDDSKQGKKGILQNSSFSSIRSSLLTNQKFDTINEEGASLNAKLEEGSINPILDLPNTSLVLKKKSSLSTLSNYKAGKCKSEIFNELISKQDQASIAHPVPVSNDLNAKKIPTDPNFTNYFLRNETQKLEDLKHHMLAPCSLLNNSPSKEFCQTAETWNSSTKPDYDFIRNKDAVSPKSREANYSANYNPNLSGTRKRLSFHFHSSEKKRNKSIKPAFKLELKKTNHVESQFRKFSKFCKLNSSLSTKSPSTLTIRKSKIKKFDSSTDKKTRTKRNFEYSENCNFDRSPSPVLQQKSMFDSPSRYTKDCQGPPKEVENISSKHQNCQDDEMKLEETEDFVLDEPESPVLKVRKIFSCTSDPPQTHNLSKRVEAVAKKLYFSHKDLPVDENKNSSDNHLDSNRLSPVLKSQKPLESKVILPDFSCSFSERERSVRKCKSNAEKETVSSETHLCRNNPECPVNSLSPLLEAHKSFNWNLKMKVNFDHKLKGDHITCEVEDPINSTNVGICDISILEDMEILNETVMDKNPESEKVNLTINRIMDDEMTCSQVLCSLSNQCSMDIEASESSATQQSRISEGNLPCDDVKAKESGDGSALTPENKQEPIDDAVYESGKKRKRRYKSGTLAARLNRLLNRTRSETRMWAHEQQSESPCCPSIDLVIVTVSYEMNKWLLHCKISSSPETDQDNLSYFVFLDPFTINNALVTPGAILKIFPKWQTLDLSSPKRIVIFNVTKVKLIKKTSCSEAIANSVPVLKSSCLEGPYCSCPRDVVSTTCSHTHLKRHILLGSLLSTNHKSK